MPDWGRTRADTPAAEKVLHFNNAGGRRAALSVRTDEIAISHIVQE